jgi:hypothetical protein
MNPRASEQRLCPLISGDDMIGKNHLATMLYGPVRA